MKEERKIILWAVAGAAVIWFVDSLLDFWIFDVYADKTFIQLLVTGVPPHEVYIRTVILIVFLAFGYLVAKRTLMFRRAEEDTRREKDFVESLFLTAPSIIVVLDIEGNIVTCNNYLSQILGRGLEEMQGLNWFETAIPEANREMIRDVHKKNIAGEDTSGTQNVIIAEDGTEILIE